MNSIEAQTKPAVSAHVQAALRNVLARQNVYLAHLDPATQRRYIDVLMDLGIWLSRVEQESNGKPPRDKGLWNGSEFRTLNDLIFSKNQAEVDDILSCFIVKNNKFDGTSRDYVCDAMAALRPHSTVALTETTKILAYFPGLAQDLQKKCKILGYFNVWLHANATENGISIAEEIVLWSGATIPRLYQFIVWEDVAKADLVLAHFKRDTSCTNDDAALAVAVARSFFSRKVDSDTMADFFLAFGNGSSGGKVEMC